MTDQIRDAATVILLRHAPEGPQVLMGLRGTAAVFMPSKYVFPGGGVDTGDHRPAPDCLAPQCRVRLALHCAADLGDALANAALRELDEETGLRLAGPMRFMFRAITPPGRTRRFDARFFMAEAAGLQTDPDDFSRASGELSHLHWITLRQARSLPLPFITEVVLSEVQAVLNSTSDRPVPFFSHVPGQSNFLMLDGGQDRDAGLTPLLGRVDSSP